MGVNLLEKVRQFSCQKSKRMRTSFKHHQLRSMQSFFNHNHNPDAKDLKELAQKTGLTKRVLQVRMAFLSVWCYKINIHQVIDLFTQWCLYFVQVWFQNARAKFRRNHLYQESVGGDNISDNSTITSPSVPSPEMSPPSLNPSSPSSTSPSHHTRLEENNIHVNHNSMSPLQNTTSHFFWGPEHLRFTKI